MKHLMSLAVLMLVAPIVLAQPQENPSQMFLRMLDADGNGAVSEEEFVQANLQQLKRTFEYMDTNQNGQVDLGEHQAFVKMMQQHMQQQMQGRGPRR